MNAADLVPAVRELFSQYPLAARLSPEQVAVLLWILCYVYDDEGPPDIYAWYVNRTGRPVTSSR